MSEFKDPFALFEEAPMKEEEVKKKAEEYEESLSKKDDIDDMTKSELEKYSIEHDIDLKGAYYIDDIRNVIKFSLGKINEIPPFKKKKKKTKNISEIKSHIDEKLNLAIEKIKQENQKSTKYIIQEIKKERENEDTNIDEGLKKFILDSLDEIKKNLKKHEFHEKDIDWKKKIILLFIQRFHYDGGKQKPINKWQLMDKRDIREKLFVQPEDISKFDVAYDFLINNEYIFKKIDKRRNIITIKALNDYSQSIERLGKNYSVVSDYIKENEGNKIIDFYKEQLVDSRGKYIKNNISRFLK